MLFFTHIKKNYTSFLCCFLLAVLISVSAFGQGVEENENKVQSTRAEKEAISTGESQKVKKAVEEQRTARIYSDDKEKLEKHSKNKNEKILQDGADETKAKKPDAAKTSINQITKDCKISFQRTKEQSATSKSTKSAIFSENFDIWPPSGWTITQLDNSTENWEQSGYNFDNWNQGSVNDANAARTNITMNEDHDVQATFTDYNLDLLWHQHTIGGNASNSTLDSSEPLDIEVADNFYNPLIEEINKVVVHGLSITHDGTDWVEWVPDETEPFIVKFYDEDAETEPDWGNPVSTQSVNGKMYYAGEVWFQEYPSYKVELDLNNPEELHSGWVSVQIDLDSGAGGWFFWLEAEGGEGDGQAWQRDDGTGSALAYDLMLELWGVQEEIDFPWTETFEEDSPTRDAWVKLDEDGDGHNWFYWESTDNAHSGDYMATSASYDNNDGVLTPDNWLISPKLDLSTASGDKSLILDWYVAAQDQQFPDDNYTVYLSANGRLPADFTEVLYSEKVKADGPENNNYWFRYVDISDWDNEDEVYIAFRHHDCSDHFRVNIDDVSIYRGILPPENITATTVSYARIDLDWQKNSADDDILIAYSTDQNIGDPTDGVSYNVGDAIGGGEIIYAGSETNFLVTGLDPLTQYYFKAWSVDNNEYSKGVSAKNYTHGTLPFEENFAEASDSRDLWSQELADPQTGIAYWSFVDGNGEGLNARSKNRNALFTTTENRGNPNATKLISPILYIADYDEVMLSFYYAQPEEGTFNELKVYYRTSSSGSWVELAHYNTAVADWTKKTITLPNPSATYQIAFEAIEDGHDNYKNLIDDVRIVARGLWSGTVSTDWHNENNWDDNTVPDQHSTYPAVIPQEADIYPVISSQDVDISDFVIQDGASLTIANNRTLEVYGDFLIYGDLHGGTGSESIILKDGSTMLISSESAQFNNLELENNSIVSFAIDNTIYVSGNLTNNGGTFTAGDGTVVFNGTATQNISGTHAISFNNVIVESTELTCDDHTYNVSGIWINDGGLFNFTQGKIVFNNAETIEVSAGDNSNFYDVEFSDGEIYLTSPMLVNNELTLNTNINSTAGSYILIGTDAGNPGSINHTSGRVIGELRRWISSTDPIELPIGLENSYRGVEIEYTNLTPGVLSATFITEIDYGENDIYDGLPTYCGDQKIDNIYDQGLWRFEALDDLAGTYNIGFHTQNITEISDPDGLRMVKRPSDGSTGWEAEGSHGGVHEEEEGSKHFVVKRDGLTGFSDFALGGEFEDNPLPICLYSFSAECADDGQTIIVEWTTATEINNSHFKLHRAYGDGSFREIATIDGAGNSNHPIDYSFTDKPEIADVIYYRLSQHDYDGQSETFDPVAVNCKKEMSSHGNLQIYPNPATNEINVIVNSPVSGSAHIGIYNLNSKKVFEKDLRLERGYNEYKVNVSRLSEGMYILKVRNLQSVSFAPEKIFVK